MAWGGGGADEWAGTLRENLDPFEQHGDGQIWQALADAHLKEFVARQELQLGFGIQASKQQAGWVVVVVMGGSVTRGVAEGENLSAGQRQVGAQGVARWGGRSQAWPHGAHAACVSGSGAAPQVDHPRAR